MTDRHLLKHYLPTTFLKRSAWGSKWPCLNISGVGLGGGGSQCGWVARVERVLREQIWSCISHKRTPSCGQTHTPHMIESITFLHSFASGYNVAKRIKWMLDNRPTLHHRIIALCIITLLTRLLVADRNHWIYFRSVLVEVQADQASDVSLLWMGYDPIATWDSSSCFGRSSLILISSIRRSLIW